MKNIKNITVIVWALAVSIVAVIGLIYPKQFRSLVGAVGDTQSTPKMSQVVGNGAGISYSTVDNRYLFASFLNSDATDRVIEQINTNYTGLAQSVSTSTTATFSVIAATSTGATSTIVAGLANNTNLVYQSAVATSSALVFEASSTPGSVTANINRIWPAGTYINFLSKATTSASVWFKVLYLGE